MYVKQNAKQSNTFYKNNERRIRNFFQGIKCAFYKRRKTFAVIIDANGEVRHNNVYNILKHAK